MLREDTIFGPRDKVEIAVQRLQEFEPPEGYTLAFSGGKDSQTIHRLAEKAGVKFHACYYVTTVDPPELCRFIREHYPTVEWVRPKESMWQLIERKGLPTRQRRWCCDYLKEVHSTGLIIVGIRWEESPKRKTKKLVQTCLRDPAKTYIHPIIDWTAEDVWQFLNEEGVPHCSLYDEGQTRIGCVGCPMKSVEMQKQDFARWPIYERLYRTALKRRVEWLVAKGEQPHLDAAEMWDWWLTDYREKEPEEQIAMPGITE